MNGVESRTETDTGVEPRRSEGGTWLTATKDAGRNTMERNDICFIAMTAY